MGRWLHVSAIFSLLALPFAADAQGNKLRTWDAEAIARTTNLNTNLLDGPNGRIVATLDVGTVRKLVEVKDRISAAANQPAKLLIVSGIEPNAFATKQNGSPIIAINLAMMKLLEQDYDAYAAIMGHEIAHLTLEHGATRQQREVLRSASSNLLGLVLGRYGVPMAGTISDLSTTVVSRAFSRDDESAADKRGFVYMRDAGFDTQGAIRAWERMASVSRSSALPFLSTHPAPLDRLDDLKRLAADGLRNSQSYAKSDQRTFPPPSGPTTDSSGSANHSRTVSSQSSPETSKPLGKDTTATLERSQRRGENEAFNRTPKMPYPKILTMQLPGIGSALRT
jgi:Zn-dependent protease with chaperone function